MHDRSGIVTCECGARYKRTTYKVPYRDKDSKECACGRELESWNASVIPVFERLPDDQKP